MKDGFLFLSNVLILLSSSKIGVAKTAYKNKIKINLFVSFFISIFYLIAVKDFKISVFIAYIMASFLISATFH